VTSAQAERFRAELDRLALDRGRLGLAVSGGPDSLALLLLAQAAMPGQFAVGTVNHGLRAAAEAECALVARLCAERGIPCEVLRVEIGSGNLQAQAREARYAALAEWAARDGLMGLVTAHHADDQAETLLMRLNRASGLAGLAGVRARGTALGSGLPLLRPLLGWRRAELAAIVARAGIDAANDASNSDDAYDRVRIRKALAEADWLDVAAIAQAASHLADADEAIAWMVDSEWDANVTVADGGLHYQPRAPRAVVLRVVCRIVAGFGGSARGGSVARLVDGLEKGVPGNIAGVAASADRDGWAFKPEAARRS
jgi:tRNA(Ile)-lysidine synthase